MIDFHCHILPKVDDGSKSIAESIAMLEAQAAQGVTVSVATPHFYANRESVDSFLSRRDAAADLLKATANDSLPQILCGAEVSYYNGISKLDGLERLCIEGSKLLLMEMPMAKWGELTLAELVKLACRGDITVALAHIERYMGLQSRDTIYRLIDSGILMQCNANFFTDFRTGRKAKAMLGRGEIRLIGSDCHNMTSRKPRIGMAFDAIEKKLGSRFLRQFIEYEHSLIH